MTYILDGSRVMFSDIGSAVAYLSSLRFSLHLDPHHIDYYSVATRGEHKIGLKINHGDNGCHAVPLTPGALEFLMRESSALDARRFRRRQS